VAQIQIQNVTKTFGRFDAVQELELEIEDGTLVALLGPSGCGKSTTMNMLSGLLEPTRGEIRFDGAVVNKVAPGDRNIGFVFQNYAIFTHMSAYDNIAFGLRVRKRPADEIDRAREVASCGDRGARPPQRTVRQRPAEARDRPLIAGRRSSCWTSRCPTSMPPSASSCAAS
jgi:ABC-type sugar transport system ATPase subunit